MVKCDFQTNIFLMTDQQVAYKALHSDCHLAVAPNKSTFPWLKLWAPYDPGFNSESHESCSLLTLHTLSLLNLLHKMLEAEGYIADLTRKPFAVKTI